MRFITNKKWKYTYGSFVSFGKAVCRSGECKYLQMNCLQDSHCKDGMTCFKGKCLPVGCKTDAVRWPTIFNIQSTQYLSRSTRFFFWISIFNSWQCFEYVWFEFQRRRLWHIGELTPWNFSFLVNWRKTLCSNHSI